jgi:hypothetical protein
MVVEPATPQLGNTQDISARHYLTAALGEGDTNNVIPMDNATAVKSAQPTGSAAGT